MNLGELIQNNEADPKTEELLDRVEDEPVEVKKSFLKMLKPAIKTLKKIPMADISIEQEFYKDLKEIDAEENPEELKERIERYIDDRGEIYE